MWSVLNAIRRAISCLKLLIGECNPKSARNSLPIARGEKLCVSERQTFLYSNNVRVCRRFAACCSVTDGGVRSCRAEFASGNCVHHHGNLRSRFLPMTVDPVSLRTYASPRVPK